MASVATPIASLRAAGHSRSTLYLAGTGSFAVEVAEWAQDAGWHVIGLIELLDPSRVGTVIDGRSVVADACPAEGANAVVAVGGDRRGHATRLQRLGWSSPPVVHPHAHVSRSATIGAGSIVAPGAVVGAAAVIGEHALISRGALVGHHTHISSYVSLLPGANVGGHARLGAGAVVGMGAAIVNDITVGADATVAAGAVVIRDVRARTRVQGVPAREYAA